MTRNGATHTQHDDTTTLESTTTAAAARPPIIHSLATHTSHLSTSE